jgi:hypothetical protein
MAAKYILAALAVAFFIAAGMKLAAGRNRGQARIWLLVAAIFTLVSAWLFARS